MDIKFIKADNDAKRIGFIQNIHYVLMLDKSGSMADLEEEGKSKWENLIEAVTAFIHIFEKDTLIKNNSRISMIGYDSDAIKLCEEMIPSEECLVCLNLKPHGKTDFNQPLLLAEKLIEKYHQNFDSIVLVMMSDGHAPYPK